MAKLQSIIKELSDSDYEAIYKSLMESNAEKSAYLLKSMREYQIPDKKIMVELGVNTSAYYTLRSRLNQRIEEYLLQELENPRADILRKVANINEILFTKKKTIAIATLKKLERELLDYDLSNELTIVYKSLKKMHMNAGDFFNYSQAYNKHVAYTLAIDKSEDLLAEYFKKYGAYVLEGHGPRSDLELILLNKEMNNVCDLYESHRLYVYLSCITIFHRLFIEPEETLEMELEPIEDILTNVENIISLYQLDSIYYHLRMVFDFLRLEYYNHYKVYRKAEEYYETVNETISQLLSNYNLYTFPAQFLVTKILRHMRMETEEEMYEENEGLFHDFESDTNDIPNHLIYITYRALSCYYVDNYEEAARWINGLLNEVSFKRFPMGQLEVKCLLALQYSLLGEFDLFQQLINSIQRQIRLIGKENCEHIVIFTKMLKISNSDAKRNKYEKISSLADRLSKFECITFTPSLLIRMNEKVILQLSEK